ncbi:MAG: hypothetical protein JSR44_11285 [Spirochaetes bacterium]|nr:hypothetical protein [Spirochaetota bacterium]
MPLSVLPLFLQVDPEALRLPAFDAGSLWYLVYFLLFIIAVFGFLHWRLRKSLEKHALSNRFMQILMQRDLTRTQLDAAQDFFKNLTENQQSEILLSQKNLALMLREYLKSHAQLTANDRVEIFDKILPGMTSQIDIKSTADFRVGELCAIDLAKKSYLATVLKIHEQQLLLSVIDKITLAPGGAHLYAYRPHLGGFLLAGAITKTNEQAVIFRHDGGPIEFRGDQHLMCLVSLPLQLQPWPHPEIAAETATIEPVTGVDTFLGTTDKISDRALAIHFNTAPPSWVLNRQDLWEMTLGLPDAPLVCRVKITAYKGSQQFLVRPIDLDAVERARLFNFIAAHEPVREHF